jgi:rubredoxin
LTGRTGSRRGVMTHDRPGLSQADPETGKAELRCSFCGYGVIASRSPPACPMCQASAWERLPWRPFARAVRGSASSRNLRVGEPPEIRDPHRALRDCAQPDPQDERLLEWRLERFAEFGFSAAESSELAEWKRTGTSRPRSRRRAIRSSCCARSSSRTAPAVFTVVKPAGVQKLCQPLSRR